MRSLIFNGAGAGTGETNLIALMEGETVLAVEILSGRGASERFAPAVRKLLEQCGDSELPGQVIAVVGPGSFTGLRASLSLAAGLARGWGCPAKGVRLGDALREMAHSPQALCVCLARRGRVFIDSPDRELRAAPVEDLKELQTSILLGDAVYGADSLAECVGEDGILRRPDIRILPFAAPDALGIYRAACKAMSLPLMPLYVDPPEARPPSMGLRPAPV